MRKGTIYGISLGPGDPNLITLKGYRTLKAVHRIYYPASRRADGNVTSYAREILRAYDLSDKQLTAMPFTMTLDRTITEAQYDGAFKMIRHDCLQGCDVAVVSEGDISLYSTFAYLLERILRHDLPLELVPGVPSFVLGASEARLSLGRQGERVAILPRLVDAYVLEKALEAFETVVLIKIHKFLPLLEATLRDKSVQITYCERLGTPEQFISTDWKEISGRDPPYFSLLIVQRSRR